MIHSQVNCRCNLGGHCQNVQIPNVCTLATLLTPISPANIAATNVLGKFCDKYWENSGEHSTIDQVVQGL